MALPPAVPALGCAAAWGAGDFAGGLASRRGSLTRVLVAAQVSGILVLLALAIGFREPWPSQRDIMLGAAAGLFGAVGVGALYAALAKGRMGVAAPVSAVLAALIPVIVAGFTQGAPSALDLTGFVLAFVGIALVSTERGAKADRVALGLAMLSGLGFGGFLTFFGMSESLLGTVVSGRVASVIAIVLFALARRDLGFPSEGLGLALFAGLCDGAGNVLFVLAASTGRLDEAAVLVSLYPAATVLLARIVLKERLRLAQLGGVAVALVALVLISI